ncbi:HEAT repeat domain-containing protein [Glaciibacter sp. 2TAF33]|uniref:HEAT repeat domain-containing protein n=1 Tax=Glaciibacter sp. 2TAF33 TaxID=3233015 RepID=UPI003F8F1855
MRTQPNPQPDVPIDLPVARRIHAAVERFGEPGVVDRSILLLNGGNAGEDFLLYVGGKHAQGLLDGAPALYWPELWGARALLHVWDPKAGAAILNHLDNQSWRVREMCARVSQARKLNVLPKIVELTEDDVPRVRIAALRALAELGSEADADTISARLRDPDKEVRRAAQQSRDALRERTRADTGD